MTPEGAIKNLIMDYLNAIPGCYARTVQLGGIGGRSNSSKGMADIIGSYKGWALAIEVKTAKGKLRPEQEAFLAGWAIRGNGIAIVARCLEDVIAVLKHTDDRWIIPGRKIEEKL